MILAPVLNPFLWGGAALHSVPSPWGGAGVGSAQSQTAPRTFTYVADKTLKSVNLAGTFNNWNASATPMKVGADGRTWTTTLPLPYGRVQYKFVLNGETWTIDPKGKTVDDGNGHQNSELLVLPEDYAVPAKPNDGIIAASAVRHTSAIPDLNLDRGRLAFRLHVRPNDVARVSILVGPKAYAMTRLGGDELSEVYETSIPYRKRTNLAYFFLLKEQDGLHPYGADGLKNPGEKPKAFTTAGFRPFVVPSWPERGIVYQLFPDRFANGDKGNDLPGTRPWNEEFLRFDTRLGGDVAGIRKHLGYLEGLGIGTVYFTPVFDSPSYHRYDARSFVKVAPDFGTNADFSLLTKQMRARGIRTVMDFAFNHTANDGPWFNDLRKKGAASKYKDFYFPKSYPIEVGPNPNYEAWYGFPSMPKLNQGNPAVRAASIAAVDYWRQNASLAGVRLDVANEVDPTLWRELRRHEKALSPDFWIVGENWGDGTPWLGGDQWDSQMGYQFRDAALGFFPDGKTTAKQFADRLMATYAMYPPQVSRNLMTLIGSHDTPRFLSLCKGDGALMRLAATVQLAWPGAPMIYYGDELGMTGGPDPLNRKGMAWGTATGDNTMLRFYKRMIAVRNANPALQSGDPAILMTDDAKRCLAFSRTLPSVARQSSIDNRQSIVALNRSAARQKISLPLPTPLRDKALLDALSGRRYAPGSTLSLNLGPKTAVVLVPASGPNLAFRNPY